jgi:Membrane bound beta barrel domain (DUF5777)
MRSIIALLCCWMTLPAICQETTTSILPARPEEVKKTVEEKQPTHLFYSPRLINANTVYVMPKGVLEFRVTHGFGDIGGDLGGIKNFFGLDNAVDLRIGFLYGLSKRLTLAAARYKGDLPIQQIYELGLKWLVLQQMDNDPSHPVSLALYGNVAVTAMASGTDPNKEDFLEDFSDRLSNVVQLMLARKFGRLSFQVSPSLVHRNHALAYDKETLFALGGAARLHLGGRYSFLVDYFHTFRDEATKDAFETRGVEFHDALGVGFEILTEGHVFHLNFTNATDLLENRFIPNTRSDWGKGQFRWGFTIARDFNLFWKKSRK